jgi:integral membrane protein (TIGR00529 family)
MIDLLVILLVFALIVGLVRLRLNLGLVMVIGATVLAVLSGMGPRELLGAAWRGLTSEAAVSLVVALALIMVLEHILRTTGALARLVDSLRNLLGDSRAVMALMPAIIGLLPSAGGARFSAPLVEESSNGCLIGADRKSFVNYWFRHIWEYVSPLYPGFILVAAMAHLSMGTLFRWQVLFPVTVVVTGLLYGFRGVSSPPRATDPNRREDLVSLAAAGGPIAAVMLLVIAFGVNIAFALVGVVVVLFLYHRYGPRRIVGTIRTSVSVMTLLVVMGVLVFKQVVEESGLVESLPDALGDAGVPLLLILFVLPFLVGLITGITVAYVGITFPLILPLITTGGAVDPALLAFAYAAGFAGVMFSPVHLCFVLTREYFKAGLGPVYRIMAIPEAAVIVVALLQVGIAAR